MVVQGAFKAFCTCGHRVSRPVNIPAHVTYQWGLIETLSLIKMSLLLRYSGLYMFICTCIVCK